MFVNGLHVIVIRPSRNSDPFWGASCPASWKLPRYIASSPLTYSSAFSRASFIA